MSQGVASFKFSSNFSNIGFFTDVASYTRQAIEASGIGVQSVEVSNTSFGYNVTVYVFIACELNQGLDVIGNAIQAALNANGVQLLSSISFNGWLMNCPTIVSGGEINVDVHIGNFPPTPIKPNNPMPNVTYNIIGYDGNTGYLLAKGSDGLCYTYDDALNEIFPTPVNCNRVLSNPTSTSNSSEDFLTQIGKALGFGKANAQTAGGITAATGGALVILAALLIFSRK